MGTEKIYVAMTNNLSKVRNFTVYPQILGTNAQICHKIIEITLRVKQDHEGNTTEENQRFKYCSDESLTRVRNEVARKCKIIKLLRGTRELSIYNYVWCNKKTLPPR